MNERIRQDKRRVTVDQESGIKRRIELLRWVARNRGGKTQLIKVLREQFNLQLSARSSFLRILVAVQNTSREADFCQHVFGRRNFDDSWAFYELSNGLAFYDMEDLCKIADCLSDNRKKWTYNKGNKTEITQSILDNTTSEQFKYCAERLMSSGVLEPVVRQQGRWVVGPLGVTWSVKSRSATKAEDIARLIQVHFQDEQLDEFAETAGCLLPIAKETTTKDAGLCRLAFTQRVLTDCDDAIILEVVSKMIGQGLVQIDDIERYWNLIVTPCGVFEAEFEAEDNLAGIIQNCYSKTELTELLQAKGYQYADLGMGLLELCLSENPEQLLSELFGRKDLNQIARGMGLVAVERVRNSEALVKMIALRLGFKLPPTLEGIHTFVTQLEKWKLQLGQHKITMAEREGLVSKSFVMVERILKDIAYFYISLLWQETIRQHYELESKRKAVDDLARSEFRATKGRNLDRLMLGELLSLMRELNEKVKVDKGMVQRLKDTFDRDTVVPETLLGKLEAVCKYRPYFVHDIARSTRKGSLDTNLCRTLLVDIAGIAKAFAEGEVYPCLLRIDREVTDEYGRTYVEATDEAGRPLVIKSGTWLEPRFAYYMRVPKGDVAIYPFMMEKIN